MNRNPFIVVLPGLLWLVASISLLPASILAQDQQPIQSPQRPKPNRPVQEIEPITPERRAELRKFVRDNLPELERLMSVLNERNPVQFQRLLNSVNQSYQRLQMIRKSGNESQYANELENWKLDTRIKMIATQLGFRDLPAARKRLTRLIGKQIDSRLEIMREEKARLEQRLAGLESSLSKLENDRDSEVDRRLNLILRGSEKLRAERKPNQAQSRGEAEADPSSNESSGDRAIRQGNDRDGKGRQGNDRDGKGRDGKGRDPSRTEPRNSTDSNSLPSAKANND